MSDARSVVLDRIRSALAAAPPQPVEVPRDYDRQPLAGGDVARFAETVDEYRARVLRIDAASIASTVASLLPANARVVVPADLPAEWVDGIDAITDDPAAPLDVARLEAVDAVVTGCALVRSFANRYLDLHDRALMRRPFPKLEWPRPS
jgi:L-lactate dehydrogenase complex protein LldG